MGIVDQFKRKVAETKAREDVLRANPALAKLPEVKRQQRNSGAVLLVIGVCIAVANAYAWIEVGRALIWGIALPIVFVPSGIYMIVTGKNPFLRLKK